MSRDTFGASGYGKIVSYLVMPTPKSWACISLYFLVFFFCRKMPEIAILEIKKNMENTYRVVFFHLGTRWWKNSWMIARRLAMWLVTVVFFFTPKRYLLTNICLSGFDSPLWGFEYLDDLIKVRSICFATGVVGCIQLLPYDLNFAQDVQVLQNTNIKWTTSCNYKRKRQKHTQKWTMNNTGPHSVPLSQKGSCCESLRLFFTECTNTKT